MKKAVYFILLVSITTACTFAPRPYSAGNERIEIMGRHQVDSTGAVLFGASGVTFYFKFEGSRFDVKLEDQYPDRFSYNWFTVVVDDGEPQRFKTNSSQTVYTLADSLDDTQHTLILSKATEGQNGWNRLVEVHTPHLLQADPLPNRKIEFIGNSITCGYGLDFRERPCSNDVWFDQHHAWLTYAARVSRRMNAQFMLSAVSGIGMHRNWNSPGPAMPDVYEGLYMAFSDSSSRWAFDRYTPQLVVIALGTNDFSDGDGEQPRPALDGDRFIADYTTFIGRVRDTYPGARLLLVDSPMLETEKNNKLAGYLREVADRRKTAGDSAIARYHFSKRFINGCDIHPGLEDHKAMADSLEPVIRDLMEW